MSANNTTEVLRLADGSFAVCFVARDERDPADGWQRGLGFWFTVRERLSYRGSDLAGARIAAISNGWAL